MPAQLLALTDGPSILLDKPILLLGRHPECDIQIESRKVSRRHCCIAQVGNYLVVRDLGSTNGIRINGHRTIEGSLKPGDELTIGSHRYQVQWDDLGAGPARRAAAARAAAQARPPAPPPSEDLRLEECDEPVPLPEPAQAQSPVLPGKKAAPAEPARPENASAVHPPERSGPHVLPDQLELAPASDVRPSARPAHPQQPEPPSEPADPG
jgi:hypothetical protein